MRSIIIAMIIVPALCLTLSAQSMGKIVYQSLEDREIYIMDFTSGEKTRITNDIRKRSARPSLSHDGTKIAITIDLDNDGDKEIYIIDVDTGKRRRLANNPGDEDYAKWSPDDEWIVFTTQPNNWREIYKIRVDGTEQQRIHIREGSMHPTWSPDGEWIALSFGGIYKTRPNGDSFIKITDADLAFDYQPAFSPDGSKIAFASRDQLGLGDPHIYVADVETGERRRLTEADRYDEYPCWSPDGKYIIYNSFFTGSVFIMNSKGGNERVLIENAADPSWSACRPHAVNPQERLPVLWGALRAYWEIR